MQCRTLPCDNGVNDGIPVDIRNVVKASSSHGSGIVRMINKILNTISQGFRVGLDDETCLVISNKIGRLARVNAGNYRLFALESLHCYEAIILIHGNERNDKSLS